MEMSVGVGVGVGAACRVVCLVAGPCLGLSTEQSLNVQQLYLPRRDRSFPRIFVLLLSRQGERARESVAGFVMRS